MLKFQHLWREYKIYNVMIFLSSFLFVKMSLSFIAEKKSSLFWPRGFWMDILLSQIPEVAFHCENTLNTNPIPIQYICWHVIPLIQPPPVEGSWDLEWCGKWVMKFSWQSLCDVNIGQCSPPGCLFCSKVGRLSTVEGEYRYWRRWDQHSALLRTAFQD